METVAIPPELLEIHKKVILGIDYMFVNGLAFFVTISCKIKNNTIEYAASMSKNMTLKYLESVFKLYNSRGFCISAVLGDPQFNPMKKEIEENFIQDLTQRVRTNMSQKLRNKRFRR